MKHNEQNIWAAATAVLILSVGIGFILNKSIMNPRLAEASLKQDDLVKSSEEATLKLNALNKKHKELIETNYRMSKQLNKLELFKKVATANDQLARNYRHLPELVKYKNERITRQAEEYKELSKKYAKAMTELYILQNKEMLDKGKK
jgi:hypothetical protein